MKKALFYTMVLALLAGCKDQEVSFPDHTLQAVYFPLQVPLRTLSLGEDRIDNSLDKELKFDIGVSIGGMYKNTTNWTVNYEPAPSLTTDVTVGGQPLLPLPEAYYTLSPVNTMTIPSGSFSGRIRVSLTESFLDDPLAVAGRYAIPLVLTGTSADSILSGAPDPLLTEPADRRIAANWLAGQTPKDWVLFGIKYVNAYHGTYLQRGRNIRYQGGVAIDTVVYRQKFVEQDRLVKFTTTAKDKVTSNAVSNRTSSGSSVYSMELGFTNITGASGPVTISPVAGSIYSVTGSGQYFAKSESVEGFAELIFQSMHLNYTYTDGLDTHVVTDTLIFRDRGIKYEELNIVVTPPI
jgi:hypothetical protein